MNQYVIYKDPSDFPGKYVVRRFVIGPDVTINPDPSPHSVVRTLDEARESLPNDMWLHAHCIPRFPDDDPVIVEVWI